MDDEVAPNSADDSARPAVHRTMIVVDIERFSDYQRTNPNRLVVRNALYRALSASFTDSGVDWKACYHEDRGDGIVVFVLPEFAKSIFVERLPTRLSALLTEHNESHAPQERLRLRMAVHAGEVHHDDHGVVGQAVNHVFRLVDAQPARQALADTAGALIVITSDWFFQEVVRHSLVIDAMEYQQTRVVTKETDSVAWIHLVTDPGTAVSAAPVRRDTEAAGPPASQGDDITALLWKASDESARRLGARRTAYPLDLSIAELHSRDLYVPATFTNAGRGRGNLLVDTVVSQIEGNCSVLVLGEPGSGKSVASYAVLRQLRDRLPAIALRITELRQIIRGEEKSELRSALVEASKNGPHRPVLLVDGLDESLGEFDSSSDVSELLKQASENFIIVVTCRFREFEDNLASSMDGDTFDSIYTIEKWTLDEQFAEFVRRLVSDGLLPSNDLVDRVRRSPHLARMVVRPLYARMVTFLGLEGLSDVTNVSALYAEYIDKLASASDASLKRAGCHLIRSSEDIWIDSAWTVFRRAAIQEDRFDFGALTRLRTGTDEPTWCVVRALSQLCDRWRSAGRVWGSFVHYSFFEYLVSRNYVRQLELALADGDPRELVACLGVDPTPEIRHFLVAELSISRISGLSQVLESAYHHVRTSGAALPMVRVTGNLVAYLLSRAVRDGAASLWRLFHEEQDMFLRQALLWGLCHLGEREALWRFLEHASTSSDWRMLNRGYLMYYYGDIDRRNEPPHTDSDKFHGWQRTRERSLSLLSGVDYTTSIAAERRYLDLHTLYDYALWRGELFSEQDTAAMRNAETALFTDSTMDKDLLDGLRRMRAAVT